VKLEALAENRVLLSMHRILVAERVNLGSAKILRRTKAQRHIQVDPDPSQSIALHGKFAMRD